MDSIIKLFIIILLITIILTLIIASISLIFITLNITWEDIEKRRNERKLKTNNRNK